MTLPIQVQKISFQLPVVPKGLQLLGRDGHFIPKNGPRQQQQNSVVARSLTQQDPLLIAC